MERMHGMRTEVPPRLNVHIEEWSDPIDQVATEDAQEIHSKSPD